MAVTTIPWGDGTNDNIYLSRNASEGNQTVEVSSDANTGAARSKTVTFSAEGASPVTLTVNQAAAALSYITDGLILHLDGIDKGGTAGRWSSLVGSCYYTLTSHSIEETKAILMDGAGYITATNPVAGAYASGTIEVCAEFLGTGSAAVMYGPTASLGFVIGASGYSFGITSSSNLNQWNVTKQNLFTISMNADRCCFNGVVGGTKVNNSWSGNSTHSIGGRNATNKYYAKIRIYSIRKYNRILTEEEMLNNQRVDNARFNLGLTI